MIYYYHYHTYTIEIIESENNITNISLLTHKSKKQNGVTIIEVPSSIKQINMNVIAYKNKYQTLRFP